MAMFTISDLARKHAAWSISKAELAETCPKQFEMKYVLKAPEEAVAAANKVGTAAHAVLEFRVGGKSAKDAYKETLTKTPLTSTEVEDLQVLDDEIEDFVRRFDIFCKTHGVTEVLLEKKWGLTTDGRGVDFFDKDVFFRGVIDLGAVTRSRDLIVIDHKSGVARDTSRFGSKYRRQLNCYAVMALANVEGIAGSRGAIHFLQGPKDLRLQWFDYQTAARIKQVLLPWLFDFVSQCADKLTTPYEAKPSPKRWPCEFCSYRPSCVAHQEMLRAAEI